MYSGRAPAQYSQLAKQGQSIDTREVDCSQGVFTNIDDKLRPQNKAKMLRNVHQFQPGMFSSGNGGWIRDAQAPLNTGVDDTLGFGKYIDALGAKYLLAQVGDTLYNYNTLSHVGTALQTGLNTAALPCINPAAPTSNTSRPFSIYCNGNREPLKVYGSAAGIAPDTVANLVFENGIRTITVTITATGVLGTDSHILNFTATNLTKSPTALSYKTVAADTTTTIAQALTNLINSSLPTTSTVGYSASSTTNVITVKVPAAYTTGFTLTNSNTGSAASAIGSLSTVATWGAAGATFSGLLYTKPALVQPFQSRVAFSAFANTGSGGDALCQMLLISALGDAETFTLSTPPAATDAWSIPIPPICGRPTALRSLKFSTQNSDEVLLVGCTDGVCIIRGTDATNFRLEILSLEFGIPSNRAIAQVGTMLLFMATDGFRYYTGDTNTQNLLNDQIPGALQIYDQFMNVDRDYWQKAHLIHHRDTQEIWFWLPYIGDSGICKHAFVLNYNTLDGAPIWYFVDNTSCNSSIEFNSTFYGGSELGLIQKWYGVNNYDDIKGNRSRRTVTLGGSTSNGQTITVTFTSAALSGSPIAVIYTQQTSDTTTTIGAANLVKAINANTTLIRAGISASSSGAVVTILSPTTFPLTVVTTRSGGFTVADAQLSDTSAALNILPGAEITLPLIGVGNVAQFCSIHATVISTGAGDQKFLVNASAYETMDSGATRKQLQAPLNYTVQSATAGQTALAPAAPFQWTLDTSAFPQSNSKFLSDFVPLGQGRYWEFSLTCNDSSHNIDFTGLQATISIGGMRI